MIFGGGIWGEDWGFVGFIWVGSNTEDSGENSRSFNNKLAQVK